MMKTIIDTDPGIDDALAIIYALSHEDLSVHSITTVAGNVDVDRSSQNSQIILHQLGLTLPISVGQSQPICYELQTARDFHGQDGLVAILHRNLILLLVPNTDFPLLPNLFLA
jgi:non-specific riboncleoside hydrolase